MSGSSEKTEKPTQRKLENARKEGKVAKSADLNAALVLGGVVLTMLVYGNYFFQSLIRVTRELLWHQLKLVAPMSQVRFETMLHEILVEIVILVMPFLLAPMLVGILSNLSQTRFLFSLHVLIPSFGKLNPLKGFQRLFSKNSVIQLGKGLVKLAIVSACAYDLVKKHQQELQAMSQMEFVQAWHVIFQIAHHILGTIVILLLVMGIGDWLIQRHEFMKNMMMSKEEIKDEVKNTEGNPKMRQRVKSAGRAIANKRMLQAVPTADVVVTNPTHFAVAIQYDPDVAPAPRVVAKGADAMAFRIREVAKNSKVPLVENKPLAQSLYKLVEVNHMVPPTLFVAVAEVLAFVFKRYKSRRNPHIYRMLGGAARR